MSARCAPPTCHRRAPRPRVTETARALFDAGDTATPSPRWASSSSPPLGARADHTGRRTAPRSAGPGRLRTAPWRPPSDLRKSRRAEGPPGAWARPLTGPLRHLSTVVPGQPAGEVVSGPLRRPVVPKKQASQGRAGGPAASSSSPTSNLVGLIGLGGAGGDGCGPGQAAGEGGGSGVGWGAAVSGCCASAGDAGTGSVERAGAAPCAVRGADGRADADVGAHWVLLMSTGREPSGARPACERNGSTGCSSRSWPSTRRSPGSRTTLPRPRRRGPWGLTRRAAAWPQMSRPPAPGSPAALLSRETVARCRGPPGRG